MDFCAIKDQHDPPMRSAPGPPSRSGECSPAFAHHPSPAGFRLPSNVTREGRKEIPHSGGRLLYSTRFVWAHACQAAKESAMLALLDRMPTVPCTLICDNGQQFKGKRFADWRTSQRAGGSKVKSLLSIEILRELFPQRFDEDHDLTSDLAFRQPEFHYAAVVWSDGDDSPSLDLLQEALGSLAQKVFSRMRSSREGEGEGYHCISVVMLETPGKAHPTNRHARLTFLSAAAWLTSDNSSPIQGCKRCKLIGWHGTRGPSRTRFSGCHRVPQCRRSSRLLLAPLASPCQPPRQ